MARRPAGRRTVSDPIAVEVVRSDLVEAVHVVDAVVVDEAGSVRTAAGAPEGVAFLRSSAKPIQAAVCLREGWMPDREEFVAVACASHSGELRHVETVRGLLAAAGLDEGRLQCPPARPVDPDLAASPERILHNCSGKHAAFLATAAARGWPVDGYLDPVHPLQQAVAARVAALAGAVYGAGVDGCGAPTFALALDAIATAFLRNALGETRVVRAMRSDPWLVGGTGRLCTELMAAASHLCAKGGAEGLLCVASVDAGVGVALKARDGGSRAVGPAAIALLTALDLLPDDLPPGLISQAHPAVLGGGAEVGRLRPRHRMFRKDPF